MSDIKQTYNPAENIVIYRSIDHAVQLEVQLAEDTVWLSQQQIATLFQKAVSTISYHISNIFKEGELEENVVIRKIRNATPHGAIKTTVWKQSICGQTRQRVDNGLHLLRNVTLLFALLTLSVGLMWG